VSVEKLTASSPDGETTAEFVPAAAMLCCSFKLRGEELLDTGRGLDAYLERGSTMGIPLLYPWANRLSAFGYSAAGKEVTLPDDRALVPADPNGLPIHGVLPRLVAFDAETTAGGTAVSASLTWDRPELLELFPFEHELRIEASVGEAQLTLTTLVTASGSDRVPVSFGFHPYLRVPGAHRDSWELELPPAEHLLLDEQMLPTGAAEPAPDGRQPLKDRSFDDAFRPREQPAAYAAAAGSRRIELELRAGFPYSQIYAPPGKDFICFEPMTAPTNALRSGDGLIVLEPGDSHRASFRVSAR
jgi:galactose mutarotase-like enzyme